MTAPKEPTPAPPADAEAAQNARVKALVKEAITELREEETKTRTNAGGGKKKGLLDALFGDE